MIDRLKSKTAVSAAAALIAALGVGGVAVAQNSGGSTPAQKAKPVAAQTKSEVPGQESNAPDNSAADQDNVQAGDQGSSDKETNDVPGDDGPGGHADEPGNPNADHQEAGQE